MRPHDFPPPQIKYPPRSTATHGPSSPSVICGLLCNLLARALTNELLDEAQCRRRYTGESLAKTLFEAKLRRQMRSVLQKKHNFTMPPEDCMPMFDNGSIRWLRSLLDKAVPCPGAPRSSSSLKGKLYPMSVVRAEHARPSSCHWPLA